VTRQFVLVGLLNLHQNHPSSFEPTVPIPPNNSTCTAVIGQCKCRYLVKGTALQEKYSLGALYECCEFVSIDVFPIMKNVYKVKVLTNCKARHR